jgi:hypothetical protein
MSVFGFLQRFYPKSSNLRFFLWHRKAQILLLSVQQIRRSSALSGTEMRNTAHDRNGEGKGGCLIKLIAVQRCCAEDVLCPREPDRQYQHDRRAEYGTSNLGLEK